MPTATPSGLHLQARDLATLALLGELGLLDTATIHERLFPEVSRRRCQQRLRLYQEHSLTRAVNLAVWFSDQAGGRVPTIHCLTERGSDAVQASLGQRPLRVARSDPKPETIHHRLAVVKVRLAMDDAFASLRLAPPQWILEQDSAPERVENAHPNAQRLLYHCFTQGGKRVSCLPDAASRMAIPRDPARPEAGHTTLVGYWEVDRSTEGRAQVQQKLPGYALLIDQRAYRRYWPDLDRVAIRLFWVCRSAERITSLFERLRDSPLATLLRATTFDELRPETALTAPIWRDINGGRREMLRVPSAPLSSIRTE
jgi:hypothetical protein